MNKKPAISVVIPAYNEEKLLPKCLQSLQKQKYKNFEIIVVDNNSTDKTAQVARSYGARVIFEKIQGMIPARERGFKEARAEIIARTDADSKVSPEWLEEIFRLFSRFPDVVASTGPWIISSPKISDRILKTWIYFYSVRLGKAISGHPYLLGGNMALRKSAWKKLQVIKDDRKVHEDIDLSCHISKVGKIIYNPKQVTFFSFRRITDNPVKGLRDYLIEYPIRYLKTIYYNKPEKLQRIKLLKLPKIWKSAEGSFPYNKVFKRHH